MLSVSDENERLYPSWGPDDNVPISINEIEAILNRLQKVFLFQVDNVKNMLSYLMTLLDSRASRLGPHLALRTIHGDYIGGPNANFRKWYFAAEMEIDDLPRKYEVKQKSRSGRAAENLQHAQNQWQARMCRLSPQELVTHVGLYLLCWGEANNIRFMPECICFIFKTCIDFYSLVSETDNFELPRQPFLDHIITPLYTTLRNQIYTEVNDNFESIDKDHDKIIGYDDMNQLFWHRPGLQCIILPDKSSVMELPKEERYKALEYVEWLKVFLKTYRESRTWLHILVNFNRVIILHTATFWYFTSFHSYPMYTRDYDIIYDNKPPAQIRLSVMALAGGVLTFINLITICLEFKFVPRRWEGSHPILWRFCCLVILFIVNTCPIIVLYMFELVDHGDLIGLAVSLSHFVVSTITVLYLSIALPITLFGSDLRDRAKYASHSFTSGFYKLEGGDKIASLSLWLLVFASKFLESYIFLTIPLKDPIRELTCMKTICLGDRLSGTFPCRFQPQIVLLLIFALEFVLFYLDTYLWYVIWNTFLSVTKSIYMGSLIWTPWRIMFARLPKRIYSKLIAHSSVSKSNQNDVVSKLWNSIIISMYREHYLCIEQVQKLLYIQGSEKELEVEEPSFFISQEDEASRSSSFLKTSEAKRRISFFAQSLATSMPNVREVLSMPTFTVLIPHYSEAIILLLKEIITKEERYSRLTLLEYLKQLHPVEWQNFVRDTKLMAEEYDGSGQTSPALEENEDLPYYSIGFKKATPIYIMRTRVWASLRSQTLYRTIFGFMNYSKSLKLFHEIETIHDDATDRNEDEEKQFRSISDMTIRKFHITVSMQRYKDFSNEEIECTEILLRACPEVKIAYIDEELDASSGQLFFYSCLIDGNCDIDEQQRRIPRYKIRLSGYPILGDGKSDNQNHAIVFTRGEYIQLIDANQDNYIEECFKIRNILAEFEEQQITDPYSYDSEQITSCHPVAIIGTREYIFSENTGVLGDIAAGKEQTFGTLFARTLAQIGGKLHYGHPDFLNGIYMNTRGGVSKAQRGLHLNEDIYAGMMAISRGGRIKHCEYMQCGKGRDLGFTSILNFITKIGAGMGEQNLSREYFYLGTQLPLDRMLSFYYAHVGFHLNNYFIILSIQLFLLLGVNLAALISQSKVCQYHGSQPITDPRQSSDCSNLIPVVLWLERCILSIFLVLFMSILPLTIFELSERGLIRSITRIGKQIISLSPLFEIFVCEIYSHSLVSDLSVGGAQYIATGRGFATKRETFANLYARFGKESITFGASLLILVIYFTTKLWRPIFVIFWITVIGFIMSPFLFNPNQFVWYELFIDYKAFLQWMHAGNSSMTTKSWIRYTKLERCRIAGVKLNLKYEDVETKIPALVRPARMNVISTVLLPQLMTSAFLLSAFLFINAQAEANIDQQPSEALTRIVIVAMLPLIVNIMVLIAGSIISIMFGPLFSTFMKSFPSTLAALLHTIAVGTHVWAFFVLLYLQNLDVTTTILGFGVASMIQKTLLQAISILFLSREVMDGRSNRAWWSGKWLTAGFGWRTFTQPLREFVCKITEMSYFAADFIVGHAIFYSQLPVLLVPLVSATHSLMIMWLRPSNQVRQKFLPHKERRRQRHDLLSAILVFLINLVGLGVICAIPIVVLVSGWFDLAKHIPDGIKVLLQPEPEGAFDTGLSPKLFRQT